MKTKYNLKLIDGQFTAAEAKEVLINVFSSKIQFHQSKNFSSLERFGKEDKIASKRLPQLKDTLEQIQHIFSAAELHHAIAMIESEVIINIIKPKKNRKEELIPVETNEVRPVANTPGAEKKPDKAKKGKKMDV